MSPTQMESGRDPLECRACRGTGSVEVLPANPKPWDGTDVDCPRCDASGVEPCAHCGDPSDHLSIHDEPVCSECDAPPESYDHPMGGMGHRIDYADRLGR